VDSPETRSQVMAEFMDENRAAKKQADQQDRPGI
jgi:hypothetical protein